MSGARSVSISEPATLPEILRWRAARQTHRHAYGLLTGEEAETDVVTYGELDRRARAIAASLQRLARAEDRALLLFPQGLDFVAAFYGCLYAGLVAVTAYAPRGKSHLSRIQTILEDSQSALVLTTAKALAQLQSSLNDLSTSAPRMLATDEDTLAGAGEWRDPGITAQSLALLQYTSGSTAAPRGVMVSHTNLLHNLGCAEDVLDLGPDTVSVSWLPCFHDMGLVCGVLLPLYTGYPVHLMSPAAFIQRPIRWLRAISSHRATLSGGPTFAYELCVEKTKPAQREALDLSSWTIAFNGAEPVRATTLERFSTTFANQGFRRRAFTPCYGLAESTLIVSIGPPPIPPVVQTFDPTALGRRRVRAIEAAPSARALVGCGPIADQDVAIVDPESRRRCAADEVGEIWVAGPSVAGGYWQKRRETERAFGAFLADTGEGPYLRTGDLGFLHGGELFPVGRLKDLILINGRNHYPQDIELTAERSHPALRSGYCAAFSVDAETGEQLVVAQELERRFLRRPEVDAITGAIRQAVAQEHGLRTHAVVLLKTGSIPKTSSGKIQRRACRSAFLDGRLVEVGRWRERTPGARKRCAEPSRRSASGAPRAATGASKTAAEIEGWLIARLARLSGLPVEAVDPGKPLAFFGVSSIETVELSGQLQDWLGRTLPATIAWDYPTIAALSRHLSGDGNSPSADAIPAQPAVRSASEDGERGVAIVGMGCRFPGAPDPDAFWQLLRDGVDAVREAPPERLRLESFYDPEPGSPGKLYSRCGGFLDQVDRFDARFFDISPAEARHLDPQQRLLLEVAWEALERGGLNPLALAGSDTGVFVGISTHDYYHLMAADVRRIDGYLGTGAAPSIAANRLSYFLDLRGPSLAVDTACSSSLVAVHLACQSLSRGESDLAIAGGVNLILTPEPIVGLSQARMMSRDGRCRSFDARADGYVRGEGCGVVVLKRLADAHVNGDRVLAVVMGSAINQDGRSNGLTAPSGLAQKAVVREALRAAGRKARDLGYVEAHGTGTPLGDPIEIEALKSVLADDPSNREAAVREAAVREATEPCLIGSVKTNIGHLEAAAGVAGLIKTVLALEHGEVPPSLHLERLNPRIDLEKSSLAVATRRTPWPRRSGRRLAGVSSFSFGGTNAHAVLAPAPPRPLAAGGEDRAVHLLTLSAKSERALGLLAERFAAFLGEHPGVSLGDVCYTANAARSDFEHRLGLATDSVSGLSDRLTAFATGARTPAVVRGRARAGRTPRVAFLFTGQGTHKPGMGRDLYASEPVFRRSLERSGEILRPHLDRPLAALLDPRDGEEPPLEQTRYAQPALLALELALADLWRSWGVEPDAVLGHSLGELAAACVAGALDREQGLELVAERGRLLQTAPAGGAMAAVSTDVHTAARALEPVAGEVAVAAVNGPADVVLSGAREALEAVLERLRESGIDSRPLRVSHAFHSPMMEPVLESLERLFERARHRPPTIPWVSNLTGRVFAPGETSASYWRRHLRRPVQFEAGLRTLFEAGCEAFVEIGPGSTLLRLGRRCAAAPAGGTWVPSLGRYGDDRKTILDSLGRLYVRGLAPDWRRFHRARPRRRIALPTYPFERERFWIDSAKEVPAVEKRDADLRSQGPSSAERGRTRQERVLAELLGVVAESLGIDGDEMDVHMPLLEIGADSLGLTRAVRSIEDRFGVTVSLRHLFEELGTVDALAAYISDNASPEWLEQPVEDDPSAALEDAASLPSVPALPAGGAPLTETSAERLIEAQLQLMSRQLDLLQRAGRLPADAATVRPAASRTPPARPAPSPAPDAADFGPFRPPQSIAVHHLGAAQQDHLDRLIERYTRRTPTSKALAQRHRPVLADSRAAAGFRTSIKEMLYPIVADRSQGSKMWDVDGNEYVDVSMDFGVNLFGHRPPFLVEALKRQIDRGLELGPQPRQVGELAELLCEMTGAERVAFCQSGSEAVMLAVRLARLASGRQKIALFQGSYHGHSDGVLARSAGEQRAAPVAGGILPGMVDSVLVLDYGVPASLEVLRAHASELAAVLVEPVQSRHPDLQPASFLEELRALTEAAGAALIFDEVITGFRIHPGGAQAHFGVEADVAAYGKVIGGGVPFAAVAGKARYLDGVDGGMWRYGDDSFPRVETTVFAGTFNKNPLSVAASLATLRHLRERGPGLQERLNATTAAMAEEIEQGLSARGVPIRIARFGSLFRFAYSGNMDLLFYHLLEKGVYVWEGRNCFLSTAHGDEDVERVVGAVLASAEALAAAGFFRPGRRSVASPRKAAAERSAVGGESPVARTAPRAPRKSSAAVPFSLSFFGNYDAVYAEDKYDLILESAKIADERGFEAVWIPERHFHRFGGFSPNPAVVGAALAQSTRRLRIRAGSVVLPLHQPIRVAEEWSVVDNLSKGRVDVAFASGWHSNDFVFAPEAYADRRQKMLDGIRTVQRLWRGETIEARGGDGSEVSLRLFPMPRQAELPIWMTIVRNPQTYATAGALGANVLTNLMSQSVAELEANVRIYRQALADSGRDPSSGVVTVLLHTFVGDDLGLVRRRAKQPFCDYLQSSLGLARGLVRSLGFDADPGALSPDDLRFLVARAYDRYVETSALVGTPDSCTEIVDRLIATGVDEVACFVDFGIDRETVLAGLGPLDDLRRRYAERRSTGGVAPRQAAERVPLTEGQKALWVSSRMGDEASRAYNLPAVLHLRGRLDPVALRQAVGGVVERHQALRATIDPGGESLLVADRIEVRVALIDLSRLADRPAREAQVERWLRTQARRAFDLTRGPLLRAAVAKLGDRHHVLALTVHHVVTDGWSTQKLLEELGQLYDAACGGTGPALPTATPFSDYARWERDQHTGPGLSLAKRYWLDRFAGFRQTLELPVDEPRPRVFSHRGARSSRRLDDALEGPLRRLSRTNGCTLYMTLLAAYQVLLHHLTGQDDLAVGVSVSGQTLHGADSLVGYCVRVLPLRSRLEGDPPFTAFLAGVRGALLDAQDHQAYPMSSLVQALGLRRDPSRTPLIATIFNVDRVTAPIRFGHGLEIETASCETGATRWELTWNVTAGEPGLLLECDYSRGLFHRRTVDRWMESYETILHTLLAQPDLGVRGIRAELRRADRRSREAEEREIERRSARKLRLVKRRSVAS